MAGNSLAERFEAKVDRSGEHHLWTGSKKADGTGKLKVDGRTVTAPRAAWELAHGPVAPGSGSQVAARSRPAFRVDHLTLVGAPRGRDSASRGARGGGSKTEVRPGVWKLTVNVGRYDDGRPRRVHRTVQARGEDRANRALADFVGEVRTAPPPKTQVERDIRVDDAIRQFLDHLREDKGRAFSTLRDYENVHKKWFSPAIGQRRVRDIEEDDIDRVFGTMRRAGLSASRMNSARNLYGPFFRWARRRRIIPRNPMAEFEMPTSSYVAKEHVPPEVDQLSLYLAMAVEVVPEVAPVLTLGAVTGMRRGELVSLRRSRLFPARNRLRVDAAIDDRGLKPTKTRQERELAVDDATMAMLLRHCERMDERSAVFGAEVGADGFVFSLEPDCSLPMPAQLVTRQVALLKEHLGIATKRPETIALEDEALRLFRSPPERRPKGKRGPAPRGGLSYAEIGRRLGRTGRWAQLAIESAIRREQAGARVATEFFDGSIIALRAFTSSELLDAGFNISAVAKRQGHTPEVLMRHYARRRQSADLKAAAHLGRIVHGRDDVGESASA